MKRYTDKEMLYFLLDESRIPGTREYFCLFLERSEISDAMDAAIRESEK